MSDNLYKRGQTWYARFTVSGREFRISLRTSDKAEARRRLRTEKEARQAAAHFGTSRLDWRRAAGDYVTKIGPNVVKPSTLKRYMCSLLQIAEIPIGTMGQTLEHLYLDQIDRPCVARLVQARRAQGATDATIRRDLSAASRVVAAAMADDQTIMTNPFLEYMQVASNAGTLRERRDPITLPTRADIERVITVAPGMFKDIIRWAMLTGMRQEEIVSLTHSQVHGDQVRLTKTKTSRARVVTLSPQARGLYQGLPRAPHNGPYVFWHGGSAAAETPAGSRYTNVSSRFHGLCLRAQQQAGGADFTPMRFHDLRHYYAVHYLQDGGSIYDLQQQLGHRSIRTTEIYLDYVTVSDKAKARKGTGEK